MAAKWRLLSGRAKCESRSAAAEFRQNVAGGAIGAPQGTQLTWQLRARVEGERSGVLSEGGASVCQKASKV